MQLFYEVWMQVIRIVLGVLPKLFFDTKKVKSFFLLYCVYR